MNPDEEFNYQNAKNASLETSVTNGVQEKYISFHGYAPVSIYKFLVAHSIAKEWWVLFMYSVMLLLFAFSIFSFYKLSLMVLADERFAFFTTITYCFYPSVLYYIGALFYYENLALPVMVIVIYRLVVSFRNNFSWHDYLTIPLGICISCLFRGQVIIVYFIILTTYLLLSLRKKRFLNLPMLFIIVALTFAAHVPILLKNKKEFGAYILSTQYGFELLQGHNPTARGSWMAGSLNPENPLYQYVHQNIQNISSMNEYEECEARKHLALQWIKENPLSVLTLEIKKMAIFFYPANFEVLKAYNWFNPINFLVHILFILLLVSKIYRRSFSSAELTVLAPVVGSIILTIVFFTGYRWRYYAEPFMIILAWQFLQSYVLKKREKIIAQSIQSQRSQLKADALK